jgi:Methyltransferase domain
MATTRLDPMALPAFAAQPWQMSYGERLAFEGILLQVKPRLAVEIGTAQGGSLRRIAAQSEEVHSFDLVPPPDDVARMKNVSFHTGDSHKLVNDYMEQAAADGRSIDFVLIDGDHSADGVRQDIVDVLGSDAVTHAVIVLHDTFNPEVRKGIKAARIPEHQKVALFEPDLVPGYLARREPYRMQMWGGLGVVVVDADHRRAGREMMRDERFHELFSVVRPAARVMESIESCGVALDRLAGAEVERVLRAELAKPVPAVPAADDPVLRAELARALGEEARLAHRLRMIEGSRGWRLTLIFRSVRDRLMGR